MLTKEECLNELEILCNYADGNPSSSGEFVGKMLQEADETLQELVEKATPKKVENMMNHFIPETYDYEYTSGKCPTCGNNLCCDEYHQEDYCGICGQALDWGEEQ